jgi:exopolysaccharide biosynthesis polyprenyl glycosylphosphotransferase
VKKASHLLPYLICDFLLSFAGWIVFWVIRVTYFEVQDPAEANPYTLTELLKPISVGLFWVSLYALAGLYGNSYRKSRIREQIGIFRVTLVGSVVLFFATILNDPVREVASFYYMLAIYFTMQTVLIGFIHGLLTTRVKMRMQQGEIGYRTLIVGAGKRAEKVWQELTQQDIKAGFQVLGYVPVGNEEENHLQGRMKRMGNFDKLDQILRQRGIEEVIIGLEKNDMEHFQQILAASHGANVTLNVVPDLYDILIGNVKMISLDSAPLIRIYPHILAPWEVFVKRAIDVLVSLVAMVLLAPVCALVALIIRLDSRGPVLYRQQRMGRSGKPFWVYKFRSMYTDAEDAGPQLAHKGDPRITRIGRFLRKVRMDEVPQFWNVLRGDMSLVGPRPERSYYINKIAERAPEYLHLLKVKPGLTSLGQVKYGYAENVDQMIERMRYDLLYIENMSLEMDLKILAYTVVVVLAGRGQ